jgi:hypothetical protein
VGNAACWAGFAERRATGRLTNPFRSVVTVQGSSLKLRSCAATADKLQLTLKHMKIKLQNKRCACVWLVWSDWRGVYENFTV